ncbi:MAG: 30S ribosomal protein S15 [Candidatus Westeberhardia cardiocondylae]|nr:30S ribosomal protein S15 [Candidatus Westeberhardia cardiocondylae]
MIYLILGDNYIMNECKLLKKNIILKFGDSIKNSGSSEVQIAILTYRINYLNIHFSHHKKDYHSRFGLFRMISKRRKLLDYLKNQDFNKYINLIKELGLRR